MQRQIEEPSAKAKYCQTSTMNNQLILRHHQATQRLWLLFITCTRLSFSFKIILQTDFDLYIKKSSFEDYQSYPLPMCY